MYPAAKRFEQQTGIPAAWTIAMSVNESGWDPSQKRTWFGIVDPKGEMMDTWEADSAGKAYNTRRAFAVDTNADDAYQRLGASLAKYRDAPKDSPYNFARYLRTGIKGAMWATDPDYEKKIARLAGEVEGMLPQASQTGGTTMPTPTTPTTPGTNDQVPWEGPEFEGYKQAYTQEIKSTLDAMKTERDKLLQEYTTWAGKATDYESPESGMAYGQMDLLQQRIRDYDTMIRQTEAALASAANKAIEKTLAAQQARLKSAIEAGKVSQDQATDQWNRLMDQYSAGIEGLVSGYASLRAALPQMGTQSMADAAKQMLYNWRELGVNIPDFDLPVMQFDPLDEIRKRLPPATDWKQALMGQQGGGGMDTGLGAESPAAPPSYSTPPGYMAGPGMPESMQPEAWRQGLLGQGGPSPTTPATAAQTAPMSPGVTGLPPIRMGGGQPQGTGGTLGVPQTPAMPSPTQPPLGQGGRPGYTRGAPPAGPTPSPTAGPVMPTPTAGPAGEATMTPDQQQRLQTWRKRNPGASPEQERQVIEAIKMGMAPN